MYGTKEAVTSDTGKSYDSDVAPESSIVNDQGDDSDDDYDFNDLCDEIEYKYDYNADKIQDAGEVTVEMRMTGEMFGEKYDESDEEEVVVVKIGGKWYIHDMSGAF